MMYGEELHVINSANADAALAAAKALEVAATTILLAKTMEVPGGSLYWGFRATVTFAYDTLTALGVLGLRRKSKVIKAAVVAVGGTGYAVGDRVSVTYAGATGGILEVLAAPAGIVTAVKIVTPGINYALQAAAATVILTAGSLGAGLTVDITDIVAMGTINLIEGAVAGKQYMKYVSNAISDDVSPTSKPPASWNAGEIVEIYSSVAATGGQGIAGDFQPILIIQNRGENFAAQGLWVEAA
jgi:hypothetical protein